VHVSFRLFLPTYITQKLILSSSKLPIEPTGAVYHVREEGRCLFGLWAAACNSVTEEHRNGTGCLPLRRAGRAPKPPRNSGASRQTVPPLLLRASRDGHRQSPGCGLAGNAGTQSPRPKGPQAAGAGRFHGVRAPFIPLIPHKSKAGGFGMVWVVLWFF